MRPATRQRSAPAHAGAGADPDGAARASVDAAIADPGEDPATDLAPPPATATSRQHSTKAIRRSRCAPCWRRYWRGRAPRRRRQHQSARWRRSSANRSAAAAQRASCASMRSIRRSAKRLDSVSVHEATLTVPWDDQPATAEPLRPGPVGEYLEVVDIDPASNRVYDPVDLNDRTLLAQDGLAAVGRQSAVPPADGLCCRHDHHRPFRARARPPGAVGAALRPVQGRRGDDQRRATRCSGCASIRTRCEPTTPITAPTRRRCCSAISRREQGRRHHDAGVDGVFLPVERHHRARDVARAARRLAPPLPGSLQPGRAAFHEAFADIVALFQHFTLKDWSASRSRGRAAICRPQPAAGLAKQFGEGSGRGGPLRDYVSPKMAELDYDTRRAA